MKRILTWHVYHPRGDTLSQGPVYYADHDYTPNAVRLHAREVPQASDLKVDIRADGVSIFTPNYAALNVGGNLEEHAEDYPLSQLVIVEGSTISFHIMQKANADDITCSLEMDSLDDDDESESE